MFNIFKKIQFDKVFSQCENNYKTLKKTFKPFAKVTITTNHRLKRLSTSKINNHPLKWTVCSAPSQ